MTLLSAAGRPITAQAVTSVHITILHTPAGGKASQRIPILKADVDGDLGSARRVLEGAKEKTLQTLISLNAVAPTVAL